MNGLMEYQGTKPKVHSAQDYVCYARNYKL